MKQTLILAALFFACIIYTSDTRIDPGNADPIAYLHAAQTLSEGRGLRNPAFELASTQALLGEPNTLFATFPPAYPVALAFLGGGLEAARIINALGLWLTLILGYVLLRRSEMPVVACASACLAFVVFLSDRQITFQTAAAETLFIPLFLAWLLVMPHVEDNRALLGYSLLTGVMGLTRYIGVPFVLIGGLWVVYRRGLVATLAYVSLPGIAFTWWFTRNWYSLGRLTGHRVAGTYQADNGSFILLGVINQWLLLILVLCGAAMCLSWFWRRFAGRILPRSLSADL